MVEVVLARTATALPDERWALEPKWNGWRGLLSADRLTSRHGKDLSRHIPELIGQLPAGTVLDGEVVCWRNGRLDFTGLHGRTTGRRGAVCFVVFDIIELDGKDVRHLPYRERRRLLEVLPLSPPLHLVESTTDRATALRWWDDYRRVGLEGLVAKRLSPPIAAAGGTG